MKKTISFLLCFTLLLMIFPSGRFYAEDAKKRPSYLFAIDAGHGGDPSVHFDPGSKRIDGRYECEDTGLIANEVIKLLNEQGQRTVLINRNLVTHKRPIKANEYNADFLISLHRDASSSASARGISIYTHEPSHYQRVAQPGKDYAPAEHSDKHAIDDQLVNNLRNHLSGATAIPFRGVHYGSASAPIWEDYFINRLSNMPSCIIEYGFGTNSEDNRIFDAEYKTLALATVKALLQTVNLDYIGPFSGSDEQICEFSNEWYYVVNGAVAWNYSGIVTINQKTYFIENGYVSNMAKGYTGQCSWLLDTTKLTVSGIGAMGDYSTSLIPPWNNLPETVEITEGVTKIGNYSFYNCSTLTVISIPKTVNEIGENAFIGCNALKEIRFYGTKADWEKIKIGNSLPGTANMLYVCDINSHKYDFVCDSECNVCGEKRTVTHTYNADCDEICNICGEIRETSIPHTYSSDCDEVCNICGTSRKTQTPHTFDENDICTACGSKRYITGDVNGNGEVTDADAVHLLMYTFFPEDYPVNQPCDFNNDGNVTDADAVHLLMYTFFPEDYPIEY